MENHRANALCTSCHSKLDPLGFGLENYDAIGRWRTMDGKYPIDAASMMPGGERFSTPTELKALLRLKKDVFVRGLVEKHLTYALGRGLEPQDPSPGV
jgi:hypothetical protein